jgi:hypothetical protein
MTNDLQHIKELAERARGARPWRAGDRVDLGSGVFWTIDGSLARFLNRQRPYRSFLQADGGAG